MATDIEGRQPLGTPFGNQLQGVNVSQQPVDLGGGFEDPMDPCTMCQQGQMEIQNAYNELTQTCNACQTQQNLTNLQQQGCQGCATAQQVINKVQQQSTGCASCGAQQPMMFQPMQPGVSGTLRPIQPMLAPLTGMPMQPLMTVGPQPGMMAGQLPIAVETGPPTYSQYGMPLTNQFFPQPMQPVMTGGVTMAPMQPMQPAITGMPTPAPTMPVQGPGPTLPPAMPPAPVMQPVMAPIAPPPPPVQQPVMQPVPVPPPPPPPAPVMQPTLSVNLTPAQIAGAEQIAQAAQPAPGFQLPTFPGGLPGLSSGVGGGTGKVPVVTVGGEPITVVLGGSGYGFGGVGVSGVGGPGAFDIHRPDLHAGGGWHNLLPQGALQNIFNLY